MAVNNWKLRASGVLVVCTMVVTLAGCNTTPERPPPPPPKPDVASPPPPSAAHTQQHDEHTGENQAQSTAEYAAPSANAADVEVEEIAVDGAPQVARQAQPAPAQDRDGSANRAGGGGASLPPRAVTEESAAAATGGVVVLNQGGADPELVGPDMRVGAQTGAEKVAAIDAELEHQLSSFDERMRRARAAASAERTELARASDGAPEGERDGRGGRRDVPPEIRGGGGAAANASGLGNTPELSGETNASRQVALYGPPAGIPDGGDDDIVARQLREAASNENDPLLREKLWEEYRKYKVGL